MDRRARQMEERRLRILEAAREIVTEHGTEGLSMRDLARRSRVTVPTIYNLIGGKDAVLLAALAEQTARFVAGIEQTRPASPADLVLAVHESLVRELLRLPRYYRTFVRIIFSSPAAEAMRARLEATLFTEITRGVDALQQAGVLADWVEPGALVPLLQRNVSVVTMQWSAGEFADGFLRGSMLYAACCVLAGACKDEYRKEFSARARAVQVTAAASFARRAERRRKRE